MKAKKSLGHQPPAVQELQLAPHADEACPPPLPPLAPLPKEVHSMYYIVVPIIVPIVVPCT